MKAFKKSSLVFGFVALGLTLVIGGCRNPFQVGLGDKVDLDVPDVALTSHPAGEYLSGIVTLSGVYTDDFEVASVTLSFDDGVTLVNATLTAAEFTWANVVDTSAYPDGETELLLTVTDGSGKSIEKRILYYFDNTAPLAMVKNPQGYATNLYNGLITVRGESADIFGIDEVAIRILDNAGEPLTSFELADGTNSWVYELDSRVVLLTTAGTVGLEVQVTDRAGNQSTELVHYDDILAANAGAAITIEDVLRIATGTPVEGISLTADEIDASLMPSVPIQIDNDLDKPSVNIIAPNNGQNIGGSTLVTGTAYDDDGIKRVEMRLDLNGDGDFLDSFNIDGTPGTDGLFEVEADWENISTSVLWTQDLNLDGELYQVEVGHDGQVGIEVRAVDINSPEVVGNSVTITVRFDDTIPRIESLNHVTGNYVSGAFSLTGTIEDDERIDRVRISYDGGIQYTDIFNRAEGEDSGVSDVAPYPLGTPAAPLHLDMAVNTASIPGQGEILSGPLYLRLLVIDNAGYQALTYLTLNVDNFPAGADWDTGSADPQNIVGGTALIQGDAKDIGPVSGFDAVHVYFVGKANSHFYNPSLADTHVAQVGGDSATFYDGTSWWPLPDTIPPSPTLPGTASYPYPANAAYRVQIDNENEFGNDTPAPPGDNDGYDETITTAGLDTTWSAEFISTNLPDGEYDIHYVVFDSAGNGTHYVVDGFVKNNPPVLDTVVLGTDLNTDVPLDTDDPGERTAAITVNQSGATDTTSTFTAVNDLLYVQLNPLALSGNGTISYSLVKTAPIPAGTPIVSASGAFDLIDTSGFSDGSVTFQATLTDEANIQVSYDIQIEIENTDAVDPTMTVDTLGQATVKGYPLSPEGHFDDNDTPPLMDSDPDLSGTFILTGEAYDTQRIEYIQVQIDGFDAGSGPGIAHTVAAWDTAGITEVFGETRFEITYQELDATNGHTVQWQYEWNTSDIGTVAAADVDVVFSVYDFAYDLLPLVGTNSGSGGFTADVVPYITEVERAPLIYNTNRSKFGVVPIQADETDVVIRGYNLSDAATAVIHTAASGGTPWVVGNSDSVAISTDPLETIPHTSILASFAGVTHSGWLRLSVGGLEATNNINNNLVDHNKEDDGSGLSTTLWTDDRYISVWEVGDTFFNSGNSEYPSMSMDTSGVLWGAWTDYASSEAFYGTDAARTSIFLMYDPAEFTDIHVDSADNLSVAYLGNYYGGSGWDANIGTAGSLNVWNGNAPQQVRRGAGYPWNFFYRFEMLYHDQTLLQFQRPKVVRNGNDIHVVYFDNDTKSAKYGYVVDGEIDVNEQTWVNIDGAWDEHDYPPPFPGVGTVETRVTAGLIRTSSAGEFIAIDVDEFGNPVVMYYDTTNSTLRLARALNSTPATPAEWVRQSVFLGDDPNRGFVGRHITMAIDEDGDIHAAAAKTSVGDLVYLHADNVDGTATDYVFDNATVIDTEGAVGNWADITLDESGATPVPYVSYVNNSMAGTYDGIKLAYYDTAEGDWEHQIVPAATSVADNRTGIEYRPPGLNINGGDRTLAIGYKSSDFNIVYWLPEE